MPGRSSLSPYRYGYQGQDAEYDQNTTGLYSFYWRQYDSEIVRWKVKDPFGQFFSPYMAMGNSPHIMVDPSGGVEFEFDFGRLEAETPPGFNLRGENFDSRMDVPDPNIVPHDKISPYAPDNIKPTPGGASGSWAPPLHAWNIDPSTLSEDEFIRKFQIGLHTFGFFPGVGMAQAAEGFTSGQFGKIIGWGEGQGAEAVQQTINVTKNLTKSQVQRWAEQGLTKSWVQDQLTKYSNSLIKGGDKLKNTQLMHRKELMEKILDLW